MTYIEKENILKFNIKLMNLKYKKIIFFCIDFCIEKIVQIVYN
jgi:hypothetical protein